MQSFLFNSAVLADVSLSGPKALGQQMIVALAFSMLGVLILIVSVWLMCKLAPFSVKKEIEEDQNTAVAILMGAVLLGVSIVIAAAIQG